MIKLHKLTNTDQGHAMQVSIHNLEAFAIGSGGALRGKLSGIFSIQNWLLGHPIPVILSGPAEMG